MGFPATPAKLHLQQEMGSQRGGAANLFQGSVSSQRIYWAKLWISEAIERSGNTNTKFSCNTAHQQKDRRSRVRGEGFSTSFESHG